MRLLLILSACLLVGCGNDYGLKKGTEVFVRYTGGTYPLTGELIEVNSKALILKVDGSKFIIPRSKIELIREE
tara:strand:- start:415 stop:633 length:219 start_codon:yes stop_codon:yes gene_type:complete